MEGQNKHFSHTHNLTFHQIPEGTEITCSGCNFSGTATVYACWQCNFFLHEQCFRATRSLQHPSHPFHPLTLLPFPTYPSNSFFCNSCSQIGTGFTYCCSDCEFDLHVQCAYNISLPSHLTLDTHIFPHKNPPPSDQALSFNVSIPHQEHTHQPIVSSPIKKYPPISAQNSEFPQPNPSIDIQNHTPINETHPSLHASPNYQTPPPASHKPINPNVPIPTSPPKAASFPCLNATNGVSMADSPSRTDHVKTQGIMHFSHPHALRLVNPEAEEDSTQCSACEEVISGSRYSCSKSSCDFHLDNSCFQLAQKIQHKSHPEHTLTLVSCPYDDCAGQFSCSACQNDGAGFTYHCGTCQFDLHIQCTSLLETVKRDDHEHPLKLFYSCPNKELGYSCDVCHGTIHEDFWAYYCGECDYSYHVDCVNDEEQEHESSTGNPILDAQMHMQRLQLQMEMSQLQMEMSRQNAQFVITCSQSLLNLV